MSRGRVYRWKPDPGTALGGSLELADVELAGLLPGARTLEGQRVWVRNDGSVNQRGLYYQVPRLAAIGNAKPDANGDFLFDPGRGGGRVDKIDNPAPRFMARYVAASHFGEVNAYYHLDCAARWSESVLAGLGALPLPRVGVVVNAHDAQRYFGDVCDGIAGTRRWLPFQGGHYRLSQRRYGPLEHRSIEPDGEIHVGPGWRILSHGALVGHAGRRYRANAAHNAGILYHEYGHHLTRHTADFQGNRLRSPARQSNVKCAIDEGFADYFAATLLETPNIWALHQRHDAEVRHERCLAIGREMAQYDSTEGADPHANGSIWASALWHVRRRVLALGLPAATCDRLVVKALLLMGGLWQHAQKQALRAWWNSPRAFALGVSALLEAERRLHDGLLHSQLVAAFAERQLFPDHDSARGWAREPLELRG